MQKRFRQFTETSAKTVNAFHVTETGTETKTKTGTKTTRRQRRRSAFRRCPDCATAARLYIAPDVTVTSRGHR